MIIDAHTHAYRKRDRTLAQDRGEALDADLPDAHPAKWILRQGASVEALLRSEQEAGIDRFVLLPVTGRPDRVAELNRWAADQARRHPQVIPFGSLIGRSDTLEADLGQLVALGLRGVKVHPLLQRLDILSPRAHRLWHLLEEAGLPVVLDSMSLEGMVRYKPHLTRFAEAGREFETGPERIAAVAAEHPRLTLIAAHLGSLFGWAHLEPLLERPNVFFDLSFVSGILPDEEVVRAIRRKGADRVLFGTDAPWRTPAAERRWFERLPLDEAEREGIASRNLEALLASASQG
jgi:hypothetical protein